MRHERAPFDHQEGRDVRHHRNGHRGHVVGFDRMRGVGDQADRNENQNRCRRGDGDQTC